MGKLAFKTLRENVSEEIRLKILNQELTPGMRIIEQDLSRKAIGPGSGGILSEFRRLHIPQYLLQKLLGLLHRLLAGDKVGGRVR